MSIKSGSCAYLLTLQVSAPPPPPPPVAFFAYSELYIPCVFPVMSSMVYYIPLPRVPRTLLISSCPSGAISRSVA